MKASMPSGVVPSETTSSWLTIGHPIVCFDDAVMRQHVGLAFGGGGAVAAHRREDERAHALRFPVIAPTARTMVAMLVMPRLPTPMATRAPGFNLDANCAEVSSFRTAAGISAMERSGKFWRTK